MVFFFGGGLVAFHSAVRRPWSLANGDRAGWVRKGAGLTQVVVIGAGHMAPADQPHACHSMAKEWIESAFDSTKTTKEAMHIHVIT